VLRTQSNCLRSFDANMVWNLSLHCHPLWMVGCQLQMSDGTFNFKRAEVSSGNWTLRPSKPSHLVKYYTRLGKIFSRVRNTYRWWVYQFGAIKFCIFRVLYSVHVSSLKLSSQSLKGLLATLTDLLSSLSKVNSCYSPVIKRMSCQYVQSFCT